jgi:bifunctional enzyme CysN/CysC
MTMNANAALKIVDTPSIKRAQLKIVIVGHVDHGKSTLVGRLLHDTHSLPEGKFEAIQASCLKRGMPFEWSFLMDALQTERDQGITIDTTQIWLKTESRDVVIIDAPGHKEFLRNMITGAAQADAALLLIDAKEGIREQSKRHGYLLHLLGVRQVIVVVNKMDMVDYSSDVFHAIEKEYSAYLTQLGVTPTHFIPVSAREGDGILLPSSRTQWYRGPSIVQALDDCNATEADASAPLRFPVQDIYKFDDRRILAGRIESGTLRVGDTLLFSPSNTQVKVASIESWPANPHKQVAHAGETVGITLTDQIFAERGHVASHVEDAPVLTNLFRARIFWLGRKPLEAEKRYTIKLGTAEMIAEIKSIEHVIDSDTLAHLPANRVERGQIAQVILRTRSTVSTDDFGNNPKLGRFVILQDYDVAGGGVIQLEGFPDQRRHDGDSRSSNIVQLDLSINSEQRAIANGHTGGILWFTGLSGSGKSTIANLLQKRLFDKGYQVFVLDGDNMRAGLARDLGFSAEDRSENIRRAGEVASLFAQSGMIVICSFISPTKTDRRSVRSIAPEHFHNVYIKASLATCETRDAKGLYKKARSGEISEFTGISAPYEEPANPDIVVDTEALSVQACVEQLLGYVNRQFVEPVRSMTLCPLEDYSGIGI